jgi:hypothetical protein
LVFGLVGGEQVAELQLWQLDVHNCLDAALRRHISATGTPSAPCFRMNAFCASENFDALIVLRSLQPHQASAENAT